MPEFCCLEYCLETIVTISFLLCLFVTGKSDINTYISNVTGLGSAGTESLGSKQLI
jgi:hypothetical protein